MTEKTDTAGHFSRLADRYAASRSHAADEDLEVLAAFAEPKPSDRYLDIATGPGHTALRIAPSAGFTVASDVAPGMLRETRRAAAERGLENVAVTFAEAAALPFADASFDLVTCRIAPHHFADLDGFLREAARVLAPDGRFVLEDSLAPDDPAQRAFLHEVEVTRDSTHLRTLNRGEWRTAFEWASLKVVRERVTRKSRDFQSWAERAGLSQSEIAGLTRRVLAADEQARGPLFRIEGGRVTRFEDDKLIARIERV